MSAPRRTLAVGAVVLALSIATSARPARGDDLPAWLADAVARPTPPWSTAPAVVLHHEESVVVPKEGRTVRTTRRAVRIVRRDGGDALGLGDAYLASSSAIKKAHAWMLLPGDEPVRLGRSDLVERSLDQTGSLYSEMKILGFSPADVTAGATYAWESVIEEEALLDQWAWSCAENAPVLHSQFSLTLPEGPAPTVVDRGRQPYTATQAGRTWTWSYADREWAELEALTPASDRARAAIAIDAPARTTGAHFTDWPGVARWLDGLMAPQALPTPELSRRAEELVRAVPDSLERIRILGREVQKLNYVSINLGLSRGEGYRPHPASQVFAMGYGDCKDKATLLTAMLAAVGQVAWPLVVSAEGRDHVDERWPSPMQFNHCIVAIRAPVGSTVATTFEHPQLGRLIAFDPTDPLTAFGDLPAAEQGSHALLVDSRHGGLFRLPALPHASNRTVRTVKASLGDQGGLSVKLEEQSTGQAARGERGLYRGSTPAEFRTLLEKWLVAGGKRIELGAVSAVDDSATGDFRLNVSYDAPHFARVVQGRMIVFRAAVVSPRAPFDMPDRPRARPIALDPHRFSESVTVLLPPGYTVDELPAPVQVNEDFGSFEARWEVRDSTLEFRRDWRMEAATLPASRYPAVRALYAAWAGSIEAPVVLVRP